MHDAPLAALVEAHLWIVDHFVSRYQKQAPHADLHAAGAHGLVEAATRFQPQQGKKFTTYAWLWVKGYILQEVRRSHLVVVPEHDVRRANAAGKPIRCGVMHGLPEINPVDWVSHQDDRQEMRYGRSGLTSRRGSGIFSQFLVRQGAPEQERLSDRAMMLRSLRSAIDELDCPDMRRAVELSLEGKSAEEIAQALECPRTRVTELLARAESELREAMT
jgi:RNA polymerase sigma factor (sigma-70 family)